MSIAKMVSMTVTLGVPLSSFDATKQLAYKRTIAGISGVTEDDISLIVRAATTTTTSSRRHLQASNINVEMRIRAPGTASTASILGSSSVMSMLK